MSSSAEIQQPRPKVSANPPVHTDPTAAHFPLRLSGEEKPRHKTVDIFAGKTSENSAAAYTAVYGPSSPYSGNQRSSTELLCISSTAGETSHPWRS
jgi:hypothetical protein